MLWKPYVAMKEIYCGSVGSGLADPPNSFPWWWGLFLITNFLDRLSSKIEDSQGALIIMTLSAVLAIPLLLCVLHVINTITTAQCERGLPAD